ncbi:carbon-nitrogen hydrolase family protein [Marinomonas spartinae]|uniref:carbon-nitrogen hydrolase family protein n=1 Tax=Marinomonas spartinae TaxID=1792290 RepID=UPI0018F2082C|nr:carbon-nitrogen hydrolase family protein [Marinomonas spartinae]MBJ7556803.1 carbon-nitrogen hydrolase family protein [Marinomonas spartinae]
MKNNIKVAAVQAASQYFDTKKCIDKAISLIQQASVNGAELIAFPELWAPGYPWWIWLDSPGWGLQFVEQYRRSSFTQECPEIMQLCTAAQEANIYVVFGYSELSGGSLYMSQMTIDNHGNIVANRRKLKPSGTERSLFAEGNGHDLVVVDTELGRLGALCCWEHIQPLSKYALFAQHEEIHVASWPALSLGRGVRYATSPMMTSSINSVYALEGGCFVIAPTAVNDQHVIDLLGNDPEKISMMGLSEICPGGGAAAIYGPDGSKISTDLPESEEGLVYAELKRDFIISAKAATDVVGQSARPDVLSLHLHR